MAKGRYSKLHSETDSGDECFAFHNEEEELSSRRSVKIKAIVFLLSLFLVVIVICVAGWAGFKSIRQSHNEKYTTVDDNNSAIVLTECGLVKGKHRVLKYKPSQHAYSFKGIPYAKAPVGELRWSPPVRLSVDNKTYCWNGVYEANQFGAECVQGKSTDSEACLFLNVFTPTLNKSAKLPVFVWIHGSYLMRGNGNENGYYPDEDFVTDMNVIGVSMNYRLNAFGFLTLKELWKENISYGNYGLLDQILVLKWVQDNIINFGGDPNLVTVSGQSSGGTSIFGLLASPLTDGLFHRAIPMSGSGTFDKTYKDAANDNRVFVHNIMECNSKTGAKLRNCLYNMSAMDVFNAIPNGEYPSWDMDDLIDFPTFNKTDGALVVLDNVIKFKPQDVYKLKRPNVISVLIGNTAQEVALLPKHVFDGPNGWNDFYKFLKSRLDLFNKSFITNIWDNLYSNNTFSKGKNITSQLLFETMTTDVRSGCQMNQLAKYYSKSSHIKAYRFVTEHQPHEPGMRLSVIKPRLHHAFHALDSFALFGYKIVSRDDYKLNSYDNAYMKSLRNVFKHFMLHGNLNKFNWPENKTGVFEHGGVLRIQGDYHEKQCLFWNDENNGFVKYQWIN